MRGLLTSSLLISSATALSPVQQVLQVPHQISKAWSKPIAEMQESFKSLSSSARAVWDEVAMLYPEAMDQVTFFSAPKPHVRKPDTHWDHITRGADVSNIWTLNTDGERERELDGELQSYDLRTKKVDPSALGVDPGVKQYSGYLDDNEDDKHLFYCNHFRSPCKGPVKLIRRCRVLRITQQPRNGPCGSLVKWRSWLQLADWPLSRARSILCQ